MLPRRGVSHSWKLFPCIAPVMWFSSSSSSSSSLLLLLGILSLLSFGVVEGNWKLTSYDGIRLWDVDAGTAIFVSDGHHMYHWDAPWKERTLLDGRGTKVSAGTDKAYCVNSAGHVLHLDHGIGIVDQILLSMLNRI